MGTESASGFPGRRWTLSGVVQGIGVRPALARLARSLELVGSLCNTSCGVVIELYGSQEQMDEFARQFSNVLPGSAHVAAANCATIHFNSIPTAVEIVGPVTDGALATPAPLDRAVCSECRREFSEPEDRRFGYPLLSCTDCGPRFSIIESLPYGRSATSMRDFELCIRCNDEFSRPADRRFHAETIACRKCGPNWRLSDGRGSIVANAESLTAIRKLLIDDGGILALKGLGGYQLLCDATNDEAVRRLRVRKSRPTKPFALLVDSIATADRVASLSSHEESALTEAANPIVLVAIRANHAPALSGELAPGLIHVGLLLPTTPLHFLVLQAAGRPLVCTSGNVGDDPVAFEEEDAERQLRGIADLFLHHDRRIVHPIDDSVVQVVSGRRQTIRLARGSAPMRLELSTSRVILATGGHEKSAFAWSNGHQAALGPHIGDLDSLATRDRFEERVAAMQDLYRFAPDLVVHDLHPDYFTTRWATLTGPQTLAIQHHHAHIAAAMLDHGWLDREVLGIAWDGTGYGTDGSVWGGEVLRSTLAKAERIATLRPFPLPGGALAIREPWRVALALLRDALGDEVAVREIGRQQPPAKLQLLSRSTSLAIPTTSVGRLFDGVAAWLLTDLWPDSLADHEGRPAMLLEAIADRSEPGAYAVLLRETASGHEFDWRPMIAAIYRDRQAVLSAPAIAMRFHRALARSIVAIADLHSKLPVVLTGGVFQNRLIQELLLEEWTGRPQPLGLPGVIPCNDGGLAAGQFAIAAAWAVRSEKT